MLLLFESVWIEYSTHTVALISLTRVDCFINLSLFLCMSISGSTVSAWVLLSARHGEPTAVPRDAVLDGLRICMQHLPRRPHYAVAVPDGEELLFQRIATAGGACMEVQRLDTLDCSWCTCICRQLTVTTLFSHRYYY